MNNQQGPYADLIDHLRQDGLLQEAKELETLLLHVAWTTGTEFIGEFGLKMKSLKTAQWDRMSDKTRQSFKKAAEAILTVWPMIGL